MINYKSTNNVQLYITVSVAVRNGYGFPLSLLIIIIIIIIKQIIIIIASLIEPSVSIAIETLCPINEAGHSFLSDLGSCLSTISDDPRESFFLFQRISILIQRFNEVAFRGTLDVETGHDE